jgi:hypothetical protein
LGNRSARDAAAVVNAAQLGRQQLALALSLAAAAVLSLALTVLASVRRRRHEPAWDVGGDDESEPSCGLGQRHVQVGLWGSRTRATRS